MPFFFRSHVPTFIATTLALAALSSRAQSLASPDPGADDSQKSAAVRLTDLNVIAGKEKIFSLPLDASPATGSRLGLAHRDLPASVSIITQEVMQLRGLRTAVEAVEASVGMTGGTSFGSIPTYSTRGFGGNNVTILRDGIRQNTASQSSRTLDSFLLDRIEVLKGPASLMFGEGAVGGAVNYLSKSPSLRAGGEALGSVGAWDTYRLGLGWGGPLALGARFAPLATRFDYSHQETAGYVDRQRQRYDAGALALGWAATPRLQLSLSASYLTDWNESYYGNPVIYDGVVNTTVPGSPVELRRFNNATDRMINPRVDPAARRTNYNILDNYAETENGFVRFRAELSVAPDWDLRHETYAATQLLRWRNLETTTWNPATRLVERSSFLHIYRDDVLTGNRLDAISRRPLAGRPNRFIVGGSYERNRLVRGGTPTGYATTLSSVSLLDPVVGTGPGDPSRFMKTSRVTIATTAFYVENAFDLTPSLELVAGLRHDTIDVDRAVFPTVTTAASTYSKTYSPWTGRVGAVWSVAKDLNLYASYSHAAEPVTQLVSFTATSNDFALQQGRQYEVGAKGSLWSGRADFTLAVFDIEKKDLLTSTLDPDTGLRISQQIGAQNSRGAEAALAVSPGHGWRIEGNLAYTDAWYGAFNENLGAGVISRAGHTPANVPDWVASLFVSKQLPGGFILSGGPRYVSNRFGNINNSVVAEAYVSVDAGLTYIRHRWQVALRGRNLLDEDYEPVAGTIMRRLADPRSVEFSTRFAL